jgi:hypothetical protein
MDTSISLQLTNKNKTFLAGLLKGKKVLEAYHEAGYKGDDTAAYTLKHRLKSELSTLINAKSNLDDTLLELDQLDEKELTQQFVTMNQKLRIIALKIQAHKVKNSIQEPNSKKTFTAFIINRDKTDKTVTISKPVDAQIVDDSAKQ